MQPAAWRGTRYKLATGGKSQGGRQSEACASLPTCHRRAIYNSPFNNRLLEAVSMSIAASRDSLLARHPSRKGSPPPLSCKPSLERAPHTHHASHAYVQPNLGVCVWPRGGAAAIIIALDTTCRFLPVRLAAIHLPELSNHTVPQVVFGRLVLRTPAM